MSILISMLIGSLPCYTQTQAQLESERLTIMQIMENSEDEMNRVKRQKNRMLTKMGALESKIYQKTQLIEDLRKKTNANIKSNTSLEPIIKKPQSAVKIISEKTPEKEATEMMTSPSIVSSSEKERPTQVLHADVSGSAQKLYNALLQKHLRTKLLNKYGEATLEEQKKYALEAQHIRSLTQYIHDAQLAAPSITQVEIDPPLVLDPQPEPLLPNKVQEVIPDPIEAIQQPIEQVTLSRAQRDDQLNKERDTLAQMKSQLQDMLVNYASLTDKETELDTEIKRRMSQIENINIAIEKIMMRELSPISNAQAYVPLTGTSKTYTSTPNRPLLNSKPPTAYIIPKDIVSSPQPKVTNSIKKQPEAKVSSAKKSVRERTTNLSQEVTSKKAKTGTKRAVVQSPAPAAFKLKEPVIKAPLYKEKGFLTWPIKRPTVVSKYGQQKHPNVRNILINNKGIDIISTSTSVLSVHDGLVTDIKEVSEGKYTIILQHDEEYHTVYSNIALCRVKRGERVGQGQLLGAAKEMGSGSKAKLHFEIWKGQKTENPLHWLRNN